MCRRTSGSKPSRRSSTRSKSSRTRREVVAAGGLHVLGTERHEARRIDRQLLGRAARQGDPGSCQFFLSLDDELLEGLGPDRQDRSRGDRQERRQPQLATYLPLFNKAQAASNAATTANASTS